MINPRVTTAQLADDILNDFYVKTNLDAARTKHNKRVQKRLMQQGLGNLSPLQQQQQQQQQTMGVSQSLDGAAWHRKGVIHGSGNTNRQLRPPSKSVSFGGNTTHDYEVITGESSMSSLNSDSRSNGFNGGNINTKDHHVITDMMHRAAYQSGRPAGEESPVKKLNAELNGKNPDEYEDEDNIKIASNAKEIQYEAMVDSGTMNNIMREVLDLHNDVNDLTSDLTFRKELAGRLDLGKYSLV